MSITIFFPDHLKICHLVQNNFKGNTNYVNFFPNVFIVLTLVEYKQKRFNVNITTQINL